MRKNLFKCLIALLVCVQPALGSEVGQAVATNQEYPVDLLGMSGRVIESRSIVLSTDDVFQIQANQCNDILEDKLQRTFQSNAVTYIFATNGKPISIELTEGRVLVHAAQVAPLFQAKKVEREVNLFLEEPNYKNEICIRIPRGDKLKPGYYYAISELELSGADLENLSVLSVKEGEPHQELFRFNLNEQGLEALKGTIDFARFLAGEMNYGAKESLETLSFVYQMRSNPPIYEIRSIITKDPEENYYSANLYYPNRSIYPSFSKLPIASIRFKDETGKKWFATSTNDFFAEPDCDYTFMPEYPGGAPKGGFTLHSVRLLHKTYRFNYPFDLSDKKVRQFIIVGLSSCVDRILGRDESDEHRSMDVLRNIDLNEMALLDEAFSSLR